MNLADLALLGYGAVFGFAVGCAVTASIALRRLSYAPPADANQ